jgi:hypothetical protein
VDRPPTLSPAPDDAVARGADGFDESTAGSAEFDGSLKAPRGPFDVPRDRRFSTCVLLAAAGHLLLRTALDGEPPTLDEPLWLRWLRVVDQHPIRSGLATCLALWALVLLRLDPPPSTSENASPRS